MQKILFIVLAIVMFISIILFNIPFQGVMGGDESHYIVITPKILNQKSQYRQNVHKLGGQNINPVFKPVLSELQRKTMVPIRLPAYLGNEKEPSKLHAIVQTSTATQYEILLGFAEDCDGGNYCRWGVVSGKKGRTECSGRGTPVILANNRKGYFINATCGAVCSDSTLSWEQDGYCYTVGIKAAKIETLIKVANSAIKAK